ncbi:MAG: hypothetical protein K9H14_00455 [Actinomycetia bacterium]|nr:hypothetical protein [Actinomycetes bacterium]
MNFTINTTVLFKKVKGELVQVVNLEVDHKKLEKAILQLNTDGWSRSFNIDPDNADNRSFLNIPALAKDTPCEAILQTDSKSYRQQITLKARRKWEIHVQNFTHTDIGYTDLPSRVARGYQESLQNIIEFCRETENFDQDSQYRWNVETGYWLEQAISNLDKPSLQKVKDLTREGRIEINPLYVAHTSEFNDEETLIRSLYFAFWFADQCGVDIKTAMASDVTGQPWLLPQILSKAGIRYFSTAVNATLAKALKLPRPFYWEAMDGSKVMLLDTDERQAYQEGIMIGLADSYDAVLKKLPLYLDDLENEGGFGFDLLALRAPGYPGDNTKPNVKVSYIVRDWNREWEYPRLKISTYSRYFEKFEKKYGQQVKTFKGAWPDWWVNYHGASAFETGVNRHTHADIITGESFSAIGESQKLLEKYPQQKLDYIYKKMFLADEADWSSYISVAEPDSYQSRGQRAEEAAFVYQAAIEAEEVKKNALEAISRKARLDTENSIVVLNSLSWERSEVVEAAIPKEITSGGRGYQVIDSVTGKQMPVQLMEPTIHDFQTGSIRIAFKAEGVPPLGFKVFNLVPNEKWAPVEKVERSGVLENDFYRLAYAKDTGQVTQIYDRKLDKDLIDTGSKYGFNQLVYETTVKPRVVDLSEHEKFSREALYLQPYFRELHKDYYDYPPPGTEFKRYVPQGQKIVKIAAGEVYTEITTQASAYMCPVVKSHILLDNLYPRIVVKNYLEKHETLDVEAVYYAFPFKLDNPEFLLNCHGGFYQPEKQQLPGSAKDWYCIQKYIDISDSDIDILWSPVEAPLVQLGDINTGKWLDEIQLQQAHIYSFAMNNHWWTNSPASQGGRFWFNYRLTSKQSPFSPSFAHNFGWASNSPMETKFMKAEPSEKGLKEYAFIDQLPGNIKVTGLKKSEHGDNLIIRLLEVEGSSTGLKLKLKDRNIRKCYAASPVEKDIKRCPVDKGRAKVDMKGHEMVTLRIKL